MSDPILVTGEDLEMYATNKLKALHEDPAMPSDSFLLMAADAQLTVGQVKTVIDWYNGRIGA